MKRRNKITTDDLKGHVYLLLNRQGPYKKRRFVLEVVRYYLKEHPGVTIDKIKEVFSDDLLGKRYQGHVIEDDIKSAKLLKDKNGSTRHMLERDAILESGDKVKFVVSSQWDYRNTLNIILLACKFGWDVELLGRRLADRSNMVFENREL